MPNMTKGTKVIGCGDDRAIVEIEYFNGLNVNQLGGIPNLARNLARTRSVRPQDNGRCVEYNVARAYCEDNLPDELRLVVTCKQEQNPEIVQRMEDGAKPRPPLGDEHDRFRAGEHEWAM